MKALCLGGIEDHVHLLLGAPPTMAPVKAAQLIKGGSSKWTHETFSNRHDFAWQDGYGAFAVSKSNIPGVVDYIPKQREHHTAKTFQEEFVELLRRHEIDYEEKCLWE